jgi:5'-3' exonuclease
MTKAWNDLAELEEAQASSNGNNLLLVDGNNVSYRWIQRPNYDDFADDFQRTIHSLARSYSCSKTIVCFDYGKSYYRMGLHDEYKASRKKPDTEEDIKKYDDFFKVLNTIPEILKEECLKFRGIEADDLITYLSTRLVDKYDKIWIVSSDRDLYQLVSDKVNIFNIFSRKEIDEEYLQEKYKLSPSKYLFSRIIEGDVSDNILGVEGIGPKRALTLVEKYGTLENLIKALPIKGKAQYIQNLNSSKDKLLRNEKLINLKKYNKDAILLGKEGPECWETLEKIC